MYVKKIANRSLIAINRSKPVYLLRSSPVGLLGHVQDKHIYVRVPVKETMRLNSINCALLGDHLPPLLVARS
jgi:hypothetical protein